MRRTAGIQARAPNAWSPTKISTRRPGRPTTAPGTNHPSGLLISPRTSTPTPRLVGAPSDPPPSGATRTIWPPPGELGDGTGTADGRAEGDSSGVGVAVGVGVGVGVDRSGVAAAVGRGVGTGVGRGVGFGVAVGAAVGDGVGTIPGSTVSGTGIPLTLESSQSCE